MSYPTDDAIERIARGVRDRTLPKPEWTHAAHFAAALWLLRHQPEPVAEIAMPPLIRAYNEATGGRNTDSEGYHETITQASIAAARAVLAGVPAALPLHAVHRELMSGPLGRSDWPLAFWSKARLFSPEARHAWIEPDLKPFDPGQFG